MSFLGGNGHGAFRLEAARRLLPPDLELVDTPYPGFEGRPRAAGFEGFLDAVAAHLRPVSPDLVYATGIGGLLALCLRARGELKDVPVLLQGAVLWGLERRLMPRVMRFSPARGALLWLFAHPLFQWRFVRTYFTRLPAPETLAAFFEGYARCAVAPDLFAWMTPALLRRLERELGARPGSLDGIRVWWGGRDRVVTPRELEWTRQALGPEAAWPVRVFPGWGHYPMLDEPESWARALSDAVAEARAI